MWLMKIEMSANPRQKSMALAWRIIAIPSLPAKEAQDLCAAVALEVPPVYSPRSAGGPARAGEIAPELVCVNEAPDERVGDRLLAGHGEAVGVAALQHEIGVGARKPARFGDFVWIDRE